MEEAHIDMSGKYYENKSIGIACLLLPSNFHIGLSIKARTIKDLQKYPTYRVHAACLSQIIKSISSKSIKRIILCNDEEIRLVKEDLSKLIDKNTIKKIISITEYRKIKNNMKFRSPADSLANSYRKRANRRVPRKNGKKLNVISINKSSIASLIKKIENSEC